MSIYRINSFTPALNIPSPKLYTAQESSNTVPSVPAGLSAGKRILYLLCLATSAPARLNSECSLTRRPSLPSEHRVHTSPHQLKHTCSMTPNSADFKQLYPHHSNYTLDLWDVGFALLQMCRFFDLCGEHQT